MLRKFAWDIFEETGDLEAYILYNELKGFEEYAAEADFIPNIDKKEEPVSDEEFNKNLIQ